MKHTHGEGTISMDLNKSITGVIAVALLAGGALFSFGVSSSAAQASDAELAATTTATTTVEELKEQVEELKEQNKEYKETIEEQKETIEDLKEGSAEKEEEADEKAEEEREETEEEAGDLKEEAKELKEEAQEEVEDLKEEAQEKMEEMGVDAEKIKKQARERAKEVKQKFMGQVEQLKQMAQEQQRKEQAEDEEEEQAEEETTTTPEKAEKDESRGQGKADKNIMKGLKEHFNQLPQVAQENISTFLAQGIGKDTKSLGLGERKAVIESFEEAYGELPDTDEDMARALMIANGRFPNKKSKTAEKEAKEKFIEVYDRIPNMEDPQDEGAIMTIAYGLRQQAKNRSLESEQEGLSTFKSIFGHLPQNTQEWNVMQAITYTGAERKEDSDNDLLPDEREEKLGTDPNEPDTDGDGFEDGREVLTGNNPLEE